MASLAQADIAPPLAPRVGDIDQTDQTDYVDHVEHVEFLGLPFCMWTQAEAIEAITARCGAPYRYVVTPNAYHIVAAHDEPARLLPIYRAAWLSLCDSRIVRALARLDGRALPLVTGSDLVAALLARLNAHDPPDTPKRILVVGPPRGTEAALRAAYPNVIFDVMPAPAALAHNAELRLAVARACVSRSWDIALSMRRLPDPGDGRAAACRARPQIRRGALRRGVGRFSDRSAGPRAALAATAQSGMGVPSGAGARPVVAPLSRQIT